MARGPLSDMPDPEDAKGYDEAMGEDEPGADESEESKAGQDLIDALNAGDPKDVFEALEHCYNVVRGKSEEGDGGEGEGPKPSGILAILAKRRKA
jgi:hypothetical protein